jgi:hypothetical protein
VNTSTAVNTKAVSIVRFIVVLVLFAFLMACVSSYFQSLRAGIAAHPEAMPIKASVKSIDSVVREVSMSVSIKEGYVSFHLRALGTSDRICELLIGSCSRQSRIRHGAGPPEIRGNEG